MFRVSVTIEVGTDRGRKLLTRESWARVKALLRKRDGETCQYCGRKAPDGEPDHVLPLAKGGTDSLDNLVWCCPSCNHSKGDRTMRENHKRKRGMRDGEPMDNSDLLPPMRILPPAHDGGTVDL